MVYLFWGMRNGTRHFSVYLLFPRNPLNVLGHIIHRWKDISRRSQRHWNREKRFRIDGEIPEISFTNLSLRGKWSLDP